MVHNRCWRFAHFDARGLRAKSFKNPIRPQMFFAVCFVIAEQTLLHSCFADDGLQPCATRFDSGSRLPVEGLGMRQAQGLYTFTVSTEAPNGFESPTPRHTWQSITIRHWCAKVASESVMSLFRSDSPPLLEPGLHEKTLEQLRELGVEGFPVWSTRQSIFSGFCSLLEILQKAAIVGDLIIDGSFLTEEINPGDIDFTLCVSPEFYDGCSGEQFRILEWIRDDFAIKSKYCCDTNLCVEYPVAHPQYFDGIQTRDFWVKLFSESVVYKRRRGVVVMRLGYGTTSGAPT